MTETVDNSSGQKRRQRSRWRLYHRLLLHTVPKNCFSSSSLQMCVCVLAGLSTSLSLPVYHAVSTLSTRISTARHKQRHNTLNSDKPSDHSPQFRPPPPNPLLSHLSYSSSIPILIIIMTSENAWVWYYKLRT